MAENCNVLHLDNNVNSRLSNGNDLLYVTADSEILNVTNDTCNVSFQRLEIDSDEVKSNRSGASDDSLKNIEHPNDPNLNVSLGDIDLSISEKFARMKLQSEGNDSFGKEWKSASFSESKDKSSENQSDETSFHIAEDLPLQETCSRNVFEETLTSSEVGAFLQKNASSPLAPGETLHCPEINRSPCPQDTVKEITTSFDAGKVSGQDISNNNLLGDTLPSPKDKALQDTHRSLLEISSSSSASKILLQDVQSECLDISLNEEKTRTSLDTSQTLSFQESKSVSSEVSNSSSLSISGSKLNPGNESTVDHGIPPTENQDISFFSSLPVKSAEPIDGIDSSFQDAKADSCEVLNSSSLSISGSKLNLGNESAVDHGTLPSENQDLSFSNSLPVKSAEPIDGIDSSFQDAKADSCEVLNSSSLSISGSKLNPGNESAVDHGIPPTENQDISFFSSLPVKSAEPIDGIDSSFQDAKADSCEVLNSSSLSISGSKWNPGNESAVDHGIPPTENQDISFFSSLPVKSAEPIDGIDSSFQDAKADSCEVLNSSSLSISGSKLNPGNESAVDYSILPSTENQDFSSLSLKSAEPMDCLDPVQASNLTGMNNPNCFKKDPFNIPQENIEPKAIPSLDTSEQDLLGQSISFHTLHEVSSEVPISDLSINTTKIKPFDNSSKNTENQDMALGGLPGKSAAVEDDCLGIPDSMVFTDLKCVSNPGDERDDPFKIPEVPQDEDEMFTDAVQFFKDPSSFQFLENIQTSGPPESVIPRSSLYVVFDPLHSKIVPGSQMQSVPVLPQKSEAEVEPSKNCSVPVNKHLADVSVRESMGNILISFDSPMAAVKAQSGQVEDVPTLSVVPKHYTEEELQQALKMHELSLQEMYLRQHRELEQEMAKIKEGSKATIEKWIQLFKTQHCTIEELFLVTKDISESKKEMQEKMDIMEKDNEKLKEDLETASKDLQSVESMFADFHKRYEQCKGMLKTYKDNEVHLREGVEIWKTKLIEQEQKYNALQERTQDILEKANAEVASAKKSSDGQVTVLKAQLKKAELKISGLESDIKQIKIENSQLGGICDDLMAQVSES